MIQSVIDIREEGALNKTGDRVRYFLYITDQEANLMINLLNILNVEVPYLKEASLLRFDLYHVNDTDDDYEYELKITFNGQTIKKAPSPCVEFSGKNKFQCSFLDFVKLSKDQSYYGFDDIDQYIKACGGPDVPSPEDQFS